MNYGYIRVSTDAQTTRNQSFEIKHFCKEHGLAINGWIQETISGTQAYDKRALGALCFGADDLLSPFKAGVIIGVVYLLQAWLTRKKQVVE